MFKCLDEVPEATEEEIRECLVSCGWDSEHAVKHLKVKQLGKCPDREWTFSFQNKADVCRMVLATSGWDLEQAKARVRKATGKENLKGNWARTKPPSAREFGTGLQPHNITDQQSAAATSDPLELSNARTSGPDGTRRGAAGELSDNGAKEKTKAKPAAEKPISRK